ncbi:hypothetical protein C5167_017179 [Papaver somniferum]|uniref:Uncharacterized protein n=1 Tax=Papaver somniferum TaxID=3469 RepID=A0A4Y7IIN1_PAPSO|nr:hypothetical protein C5167_017179 [Papaver somniferum]
MKPVSSFFTLVEFFRKQIAVTCGMECRNGWWCCRVMKGKLTWLEFEWKLVLLLDVKLMVIVEACGLVMASFVLDI